MTWTDDSTPETVTEDVAGDGKFMADGVLLNSGEGIQFDCSRIDVSPTEPWAIEAYVSIDNVTYGSHPVASRRLDVGALEGNLNVTRAKYVKVRILNADISPTDLVSVSITYSKDGMNF